MTEQYFIGIDVSKDNLDVFIHPEGAYRRYANTRAGRKTLLSDIGGRPVALVVFEATGGYERALRQTLANESLPHACVQPMRVRHFMEAQGRKAKTDRLDARALALFAAAGMTAPSAALDEDRLALRDLTRTLTFVRKQISTLKCQMEKMGEKGGGTKALAKLLRAGEEQEQALLKAIEKHIGSAKDLKALIDLLASMPGVGFYTACVLIAELPELGACSKAEISALTGTAPFARESGKRKGQAAIKGGRHHARKALYMAAVTAMRFNPAFKDAYQDMRKRGKCFKVAITALMRKMVVALNAMVKKNQPWEQFYA